MSLIARDNRLIESPSGGTLPIVGTAKTGVSIAVGQFVYYDPSDLKFGLADNATQAKATHCGVCVVATTAAGSTFTFMPINSVLTIAQLGGFTPTLTTAYVGLASAPGAAINLPTTSGQFVSPAYRMVGPGRAIIVGQTPIVIP